MKERKSLSTIFKIIAILAIFLLGASGGYFYSQKQKPPSQIDLYSAFLDEVYQTIQQNYWEKIDDQQLTTLFQLAAEKLTSQPQPLKSKDKPNLEKLLTKILNQLESEEKKKEFTSQLTDIVLANLKPFGRNQLYTQKQEIDLKNRVENINPETGEKEPTIDSRLIRPEIFYLHLKKFSPTTFDEFKKAVEEVDHQPGLNTVILDLRDNVGGAIDIMPYFLGPFIGQDQYAYEFFHQNEKTTFKTKTGWLPSLVRYKKVVILINENVQSSAELFAAVLKKYNVGVLIGTPTRGWGTVEKVFPLENQLNSNQTFSIFLVHSLVLREDGQPIEGNGVEPMINLNDPDWQNQLLAYFNYQELVEVVKEIIEAD